MVPQVDTLSEVTTGVDRVELSVLGHWPRDVSRQLKLLEPGEIRLEGKRVRIFHGGSHGFDFYPISVQKCKLYRIDPIFEPASDCACRLYLYSRFLARYGFRESVERMYRYLERLGFGLDGEQISVLHLCADVATPTHEFAQRVDDRRFVSRLKPTPLGKANYKTTRYLGSRKSMQICIYDKAKQLGVTGPLTRVEYRMGRKYFYRRSDLTPKSVPQVMRVRFG